MVRIKPFLLRLINKASINIQFCKPTVCTVPIAENWRLRKTAAQQNGSYHKT